MVPETAPVLIKETLEKTSNTVVFLSQRVDDLNRSKILQTLFLLEEASWKKQVCPF